MVKGMLAGGIFSIVGACCIGVVIVNRIKKIKAKNTDRIFMLVLGTGFLIMGCSILIASFSESRLAAVIAFVILGLWFLYLAWRQIASLIVCKQKIWAEYCGFSLIPGRFGNMAAPVFAYTYGGQTYKQQSGASHTLGYVQRRFKEGEQVIIKIDPKEPE